ncbi:vitamin K epoxide reductase family protein [Chryseobacterium gleum]|uniref:vitamin K epoxide reductase family protein n=1 Tax=Chryseobacterium gleum TaxID=250 RepID=UPI001E45D433|nr:vitamin K epoxide reductase family protein [Chryseobacterium gleum]MCE4065961.1 vitamin K epoxide reductase family protein [Chryseobacterium gleum]
MIENLENIIKYLKSENIFLDKDEFAFQLNSHPAYPSLLSLTSTFNINKISNYVLEVEETEIEDLPEKFMTYMLNSEKEYELSFIRKQKNRFLVNNQYKLQKKDFTSKWNNIIILADNANFKSGKKNRFKHKYFFFLITVFFLAYLFFKIKLNSLILLVLSLIGFFLAGLSLKEVFNIKNIIVNKVCSGTYTNCSILNSKKNNIFSNFADYGLIYFFTNIVIISFTLNSSNENLFSIIQKPLIFIVLAVVGISLFYQIFRIKKVCPLCILIIIILLIQTCILV